VHIAQPFGIPVPSDVEGAVRSALERRDLDGAERLLGMQVSEFVARVAANPGRSDSGDIYNGGAALSEEALNAYCEARRGDFLFLRRELPVASLHSAITDRFVFPWQQLRVVAAVAQATMSLHELYVFVGRAMFKGFEKSGGLGVYEMVAPHSPFFTLIGQHHLPAWLREHERAAPMADELSDELPSVSWDATGSGT
jgi:hypothetical protein